MNLRSKVCILGVLAMISTGCRSPKPPPPEPTPAPQSASPTPPAPVLERVQRDQTAAEKEMEEKAKAAEKAAGEE